jgi:hypothetical protein
MDNGELADGEDSSKSPASFVKKTLHKSSRGDENKVLDIPAQKHDKSVPPKKQGALG